MQRSPSLSPFLSLSSLPPSLLVSEYDLPPPFQWQGHRFGLLWIAVGWSFVTLAAAVLSLGMVHMARGQGSGSVRTMSVSGYSTAELLLVSFGKIHIVHFIHQSLDKYCPGWLFTHLISWGFDIWLILNLCGCVPVCMHMRLKIDSEVRGQRSTCLW